MKFSIEQMQEFVKFYENELFSQIKINFSMEKDWTAQFPEKAGIYAIFDKEKFIYVGETSQLRERMKDIRRTVNHTFRRKLGKLLDENEIIEKYKFSSSFEGKLNEYCKLNITVSYLEVNFGRLEIESFIIRNNKPILNSIEKRGVIK